MYKLDQSMFAGNHFVSSRSTFNAGRMIMTNDCSGMKVPMIVISPGMSVATHVKLATQTPKQEDKRKFVEIQRENRLLVA